MKYICGDRVKGVYGQSRPKNPRMNTLTRLPSTKTNINAKGDPLRCCSSHQMDQHILDTSEPASPPCVCKDLYVHYPPPPCASLARQSRLVSAKPPPTLLVSAEPLPLVTPRASFATPLPMCLVSAKPPPPCASLAPTPPPPPPCASLAPNFPPPPCALLAPNSPSPRVSG